LLTLFFPDGASLYTCPIPTVSLDFHSRAADLCLSALSPSVLMLTCTHGLYFTHLTVGKEPCSRTRFMGYCFVLSCSGTCIPLGSLEHPMEVLRNLRPTPLDRAKAVSQPSKALGTHSSFLRHR
jgi:hypothetical protein